MDNPFHSGKGLSRIREGKSSSVDGPLQAKGYQWGGQDCNVDDVNCLAKEVFDPETGRTRYLIKRATSGGESGRLYNPGSSFFCEAGLRRGQYEFRVSPKAAFDLFLAFIREPHNPSAINAAERECVS